MPLLQTKKASLEAARTAWARLSQKQRNSVVGKTFLSVLDMLDQENQASLLGVLGVLFDGDAPAQAYNALKTQFINRPFKDEQGQILLKLCASRVALKTSTPSAASSPYAQAHVWFELANSLDASNPALRTIPKSDVQHVFTEGAAIDIAGSQSVELAKSEALRVAEAAQALTKPHKSALNYGTQSMRQGVSKEGFNDGTLGLHTDLNNESTSRKKQRGKRGEPYEADKYEPYYDNRNQGTAPNPIKGDASDDSDAAEQTTPPATPTSHHTHSNTVTALPTLLRWAQSNSPSAPRLYALLGDAGSGKTSHGQQFARVLNGEVAHADWPTAALGELAPQALFIDLAELSGVDNLAQLSLEEMLVLVLKRRDGVLVQTVADVAPLVADARAGRLIFIFDGLDELLKNDALVLQKVFEQFLKVVERRPTGAQDTRPPKAIVSCRSHYFRDVEAQHSFFTARGRHHVATDDYRCITLLPWGNDLIQSYLTRRLGAAQASRMLTLIANTYNLAELASKPVLLSMMGENLQALLALHDDGQPILAATLYNQTVASWIERDDGKHRINSAHKPLLMGALAAALHNDQAEAWPADRLDQWLVRSVQDLFAGHYAAADMQGLQNDLRTATFIVRPDERQFNFAHKSYGEYFLARFMVDSLTQVADGFWTLAQLRQHLPAHPLNRETTAFLNELWAMDHARLPPRSIRQRNDVLCQMLQYQGLAPGSGQDMPPAPPLHAVLWQMLCAISRPLSMANGQSLSQTQGYTITAPAQSPNIPLNLRGLSFAEQRWEGLDTRQAPPLDLRGASLRGLYALRCQFGQVLCNAQTNANQAVFRDCETRGISWNGAPRNGMVLRSSANARYPARPYLLPPEAPLPSALAAPWSMPRSMSGFNSVAFDPLGAVLASGGDDGSVRLWDVASRSELAVLQGHGCSVLSVAFDPLGAVLASGSDDGSVRLWDVASRSELAVLKGHEGLVMSVAFDPLGAVLASGGSDGSVRLWDVAARSELAMLKGHGRWVTSVAFDRSGAVLASGCDDGSVQLWDVAARSELAVLKGHGRSVISVAFGPSGAVLASGGHNGSVRLWNVASRSELAVLKGHGRSVRSALFDPSVLSVTFDPSGAVLASGGADGSMRLWDVASCSELARLQGHDGSVLSVAYDPSGAVLASGGDDGSVRLWDVAARSALARLQGHGRSVFSVAFDPSGAMLASGGGDGSVRLWDVAARSELAVLKGHGESVRSVAFDPSGAVLASSSDDGSVRLWDVDLQALRSQLSLRQPNQEQSSSGQPKAVQVSYTVIVPAPFAPFDPSWARFTSDGALLDWSDSAVDHWLHAQRDGRAAPIESVL